MTTGLYPQELVISFGAAAKISTVSTRTVNASKIMLQKSEYSKPTGWKDFASAGSLLLLW